MKISLNHITGIILTTAILLIPKWSIAQNLNQCAETLKGSINQASDINLLVNEFIKKDFFYLRKGEFEKTSDFDESRKNTILHSINKKSLLDDGSIIFFIKIKPERITYNADKEKMEGYMISSFRSQFGLTKSLVLSIISKEVSSSRYMANNSFGARIEVSKTVYDDTVIEYKTNIQSSQTYGTEDKIMNLSKSGVNMTPEKFKKINRNLIFAFSAKLNPPYISVRTEFSSPTMTIPIDTEKRLKVLHMSIGCGAFFSPAINEFISDFVEP